MGKMRGVSHILYNNLGEFGLSAVFRDNTVLIIGQNIWFLSFQRRCSHQNEQLIHGCQQQSIVSSSENEYIPPAQ